MDEDRITITDVQKAGFCVRGARTWFTQHKLDFRKFIDEGISVDDFLATGDAAAESIVQRKREREAR